MAMAMATRKIRKLEPNIEKNKLEERKVWSDLPTEISLLIFSLLTFKERICASVVCKSWFSALFSGRLLKKSPLLMIIWKRVRIFELYNPSTGKANCIKLPQLRRCSTCLFSIDGWLLNFQKLTLRVFFLNPYTEGLIELPRFNLSRDHLVAVSSSPVSRDCTVFTVKSISPTTVAISTCNVRSIEWTTNYYPISEPTLNNKCASMVFCNGLLYCMSYKGLRIFDTQTCKWNPNVVHLPKPPRRSGGEKWRVFLSEHEGNVFFCCIGDPVIFKLDQKNGKWEKMNTLDGDIFFIGSVSAIAKDNVLGMKANNIYFPCCSYGQPCIRYSFDEGGYYLNTKYTLPKKSGCNFIWIDPPADDASFCVI